MFFIFLIIAAGIGYFIYQKYVTPTGNEPTTTKTDPIYPSKTPKPLTSSSSTNVGGKSGAEASTSKFGKSTVSKSPVKKPRSPRPIQVITLGIGGDDLAPGVVSTAQAPAPAPVSTPPPSLQAPPVAPLARDLNNNVPTPARAPATPPPAAVDINNNNAPAPVAAPTPAPATPPPVSTPAPAAVDLNNNNVPAPVAATESSSTRTAIEPADSTQDDKSDKRQTTPSAAQIVQSPTPDVVTARSPAPSEIPPPSAAAGAAALDDKPSEDVKTAKIINENSLREKSEGEISSPAPVTPEAGGAAAPPALGGGSEREKANNNENDGTASTQSAPPGTVVDPAAAAALGTDGKKKKAKKSKDGKKKKSKKNSAGGKSGGTEDEKKKKKKSKKSKDGKKKKSKKNSGGGEKGPEEKKSEDDATPPAPPAAPPAPGL